MKSVDFKSLVMGGLLVLVILCAVGAVPWLGHESFQRFTIVTMNNNRAFMLDTATGEAWNFEEPAENTLLNINTRHEFFAPKTDVLVYPVAPSTTTP